MKDTTELFKMFYCGQKLTQKELEKLSAEIKIVDGTLDKVLLDRILIDNLKV